MLTLSNVFTGLHSLSGPDPHLLLAARRTHTVKCIQSAARNLGFTVSLAEEPEIFGTQLVDGKPDLVVLDLNVTDSFGVAALRQLASASVDTGLVLISGRDEPFLKWAERMIIDSGLRLQGVIGRPLEVVAVERVLSRAIQELMFDEHELAQALSEGQIRVHYQPVMDLYAPDRWRIDSFEALARWQHSGHGLVTPVYFLPLAESCGMVRELSRQLVELTFAEFAPVLDGHRGVSLSLNISPCQLREADWPDELQYLAGKHRVDPARIVLELSEPALDDPAEVAAGLVQLRERGFRLCVDDFGVGSSSLFRFFRMSFSELKIHRSLIANLNESGEARIIVELLIDLARRLGLRVCATGVEHRSNVEMLRAMGCEAAQGFYFGDPVPIDRIAAQYLWSSPATPVMEGEGGNVSKIYFNGR